MKLTPEQVSQWLLDNPDQADKFRKLLCTEQYIAQEAAKRIGVELFWEQIANALPTKSPQQTIDTLLDLKRRIEGTINETILNIAYAMPIGMSEQNHG